MKLRLLTLTLLALTSLNALAMTPGQLPIDTEYAYQSCDTNYKIYLRAGRESIGHIFYRKQENATWKIEVLYVADAYRRRGYAKKLFTRCLEHMASMGCKHIIIDAKPLTTNDPSRDILANMYAGFLATLAAPLIGAGVVEGYELGYAIQVIYKVTNT